MAIRRIPFVLCIVASLLLVNLGANAAFPGTGEIPAPPGHDGNPNPPGHDEHPNPPGPGDHPNIPDLGDHPDPPGHDGNPNPPGNHGGPPDDQTVGLENALGHIGDDNPGNAYDVLNYLSGLEELPPTYPPGLGHSPPGPSGFAPTSFESQPLSSGGTIYAANPEPATLGLLLLGALAMLRRRR